MGCQALVSRIGFKINTLDCVIGKSTQSTESSQYYNTASSLYPCKINYLKAYNTGGYFTTANTVQCSCLVECKNEPQTSAHFTCKAEIILLAMPDYDL